MYFLQYLPLVATLLVGISIGDLASLAHVVLQILQITHK